MQANSALLSLPSPSDSRLAVKVTADAVRHIRAGHPWVYDQSIQSVSRPGNAGDLAVIFDKNRKFLAIGLFDPASPIRIKILHVGKPTTINADFWTDRLRSARTLRQSIIDDPETTAYRLVNGENDGLPGFIVDRYAKTLVVKLYSAAWFPHLPTLLSVLRTQEDPEDFVLRLSRNVAKGETFGCKDGMVLALNKPVASDDLPTLSAGLADERTPVSFLENGLKFRADLLTGQKTGHFLDQRDNRARVRALAQGQRVLDVFCCTGGFSLAAAAGGAASVHAVDLAPAAVRQVSENFDRNQAVDGVAQCKLSTAINDAFEEMEQLAAQGRQFDLIVIDPPSFAQKQEDISRAQRAYRRLTSLGLGVLAPGGTLVQASCSSRLSAERFFDGVQEAARLNGYDLGAFEYSEHALDHPSTFAQGSYMKAVFSEPRRRGGANAHQRSQL